MKGIRIHPDDNVAVALEDMSPWRWRISARAKH